MKKYFEFKKYDQKTCLKVCLQKFITEKCNCFDFSLKLKNDSTYKGCFKQEELECINLNEKIFYDGQSKVDECYLNCNSLYSTSYID